MVCTAKPQRRNRARFALAAATVAAACWGVSKTFTGITAGPSVLRTRALVSRAAGEDYPELARVEGLIYDSCMLKEGEQEIQCLRVWDKLTKYHEEAKLECNLEDLRCIVLDVLDRLCSKIDGKDGLIILNKMSSAMVAFRSKFKDWDAAFSAVDTDNSDSLDLEELTVAMRDLKVEMTDNEVAMIFAAADANGDGVISRQEFSDFLTAAVFAEEPLRELQPDSLSLKQPSFDEYLRWTSRGSGSLAGIGR